MKTKIAVVLLLAVALVFAGAVLHRVHAQSAGSKVSRVAGFYDAVQYGGWGMYVQAGNSATGSQTVTFCPAFVPLPDGRVIQPLAPANTVFSPFTIDPQSSTVETLTPTAYSLVSVPNVGQCASVTASFSNTHSASLNTSQVVSGDAGIQEAINDASLNGGGMVHWVIDPGIVTLNTGGATTNVGSINIPSRSVVLAAGAKVTTTIGTCAGGWSLGFATGSGTDFTAANTTLTAGTTTDSSTIAVPKVTPTAQLPTIFCTTSNASAGAVHPHYEGYKVVAPAS